MPLLEPSPDLVTASTYERTVAASLDRVWENVLDWEHLPWLHARTFDSIEKLEAGFEGWRAKLTESGGGPTSTVELKADRAAGHYVVLAYDDGEAAARTEVWTRLAAADDDATRVEVEFRMQPLPEETLAAFGQAYVGAYTELWDEDEEMMVERAERLREQVSPPADTPVDLGPERDLRARLPLDVVFEGRRFRVVAEGEDFVVHPSVCPHMLGPLFAAADEPGVLECPWHGYRYDAAERRSCDGRALRLPPAPVVSRDASSGRCTLMAPE